jgi:hypothetical protein
MRTLGTAGAACAAGLAAILLCVPPARAAAKNEHARAAAKIVEETLEREAREGLRDRSEPLKPALEQVPDYGPARWHSGFVYDAQRKQWLRPREAADIALQDNRLAAYRRAREKSAETVEGQSQLARWCAKRKLDDQARAHWTRVLQWQPDHEEALGQLGLQMIQGNWVSDRDIAEAQTCARKASAAAAKWVPRLEKLRDRLAGKNARQAQKAREELMAIDDPEAVEALDVVFCRQASETALLGIELLGKIQSPQAAAVLAWHAAFSPWPPVREAAATALRLQEKYHYVPLLVGAMRTPIEPGPQVGATSGDGGTGSGATQTPMASATPTYGSPRVGTLFRLDHRVSTYSFSKNENLKEHPYWWQSPQTPLFSRTSPDRVANLTNSTVQKGGDRSTTQAREYYVIRDNRLQSRRTEGKVTVDKQVLTPVGTYTAVTKEQAEAYQRQVEAARYNLVVSAQNAALASALAEATGQHQPRSPSEWWQWWYDYNEVYVPSEKPRLAPDQPHSTAPAAGTEAQRGDCLAADTLVCTETGPTTVEKVAVGDRVFCCDPETGCLALAPVLRITVRPEGSLLKVRAGGEEFQSSGGHVFWVAGRGWVKARDLGEGMQLHTLRGTVPVDGIEPGTVQKTFGLVTADLHTFFAGKAAVLTHDNTIRPPTDRIVPGLAPKATRPAEP